MIEDLCVTHFAKKGKSRYGVARVQDDDGRSYQSAWERECMAMLRERERRGEIHGLTFQVWFWLCVDKERRAFVRVTLPGDLGMNVTREGMRVSGYVADALYYEFGKLVVADAKNRLLTDTYKKKRRWMEWFEFPIFEMHAPRGWKAPKK